MCCGGWTSRNKDCKEPVNRTGRGYERRGAFVDILGARSVLVCLCGRFFDIRAGEGVAELFPSSQAAL